MVGTTLNMDAHELTLKDTHKHSFKYCMIQQRHLSPLAHVLIKNQSYWPLAVLWSYDDSVAVHQVIFNNHCHTQVCRSQRPQHADTKRDSWQFRQNFTLGWTSLWLQGRALYLVYFWIPISFGIDSGRMMTRHTRKRENRWSVYQWCGISPSLEPVIVSYKEMDTETQREDSLPAATWRHQGMTHWIPPGAYRKVY